MIMMNKDAKIFVTGHKGMFGYGLIRRLKAMGYNKIIIMPSSELTKQDSVRNFFQKERPDYVFIATIKEGGIQANMSYPADLIYTNLQIEANLIHSAWETKVKKLLFMGSSCIYPKFCPQPMKEEHLLTGDVEPTNDAYSIAKIVGIKMCQAYNRQYGTNFISVIPTMIYGPGDSFDLKTSHVLPSLIIKFEQAKKETKNDVTLWGTGSPRREFLYIDDFVDACIFLMNNYDKSEMINVGYGSDISIKELALMVKAVTRFDGELVFDTSKPDGMPAKLLDTSKLTALGWKPKIDLKKGLEETYRWYLQNIEGREQ